MLLYHFVSPTVLHAAQDPPISTLDSCRPRWSRHHPAGPNTLETAFFENWWSSPRPKLGSPPPRPSEMPWRNFWKWSRDRRFSNSWSMSRRIPRSTRWPRCEAGSILCRRECARTTPTMLRDRHHHLQAGTSAAIHFRTTLWLTRDSVSWFDKSGNLWRIQSLLPRAIDRRRGIRRSTRRKPPNSRPRSRVTNSKSAEVPRKPRESRKS